MKKLLTVLFSILLLSVTPCVRGEDAETLPAEGQGADPKETAPADRMKITNIDARMLYGQYNAIASAFSITQNFKNFAYQLNSDLKRSNDFGYKNSSYYESDIGFTGKADLSENWKMTPSVELNNDSHGMFRNLLFSREEKDQIMGGVKFEYKPMPYRWEVTMGGGQFVNRFVSSQSISVERSSFYKMNGGVAYEYIWSASNKLRFDTKVAQYDFSSKTDNNTFVASELLGSFRLAENFMLMLGPTYAWNRDDASFPSGKIDLSTIGLKVLSVQVSYRYELVPFKPEEVYFEQKFVYPNYRLHPQKVHLADLKIGIEYKNTSDSDIRLKSMRLKLSGQFERNTKYYNYFFFVYDILSMQMMRVLFARGKGDLGFTFGIHGSELGLGLFYEYMYSYSDKHVTYRPEHTAGGNLKFALERWEFEWSNVFKSRVFIDPNLSGKLGIDIKSSASLQFKVIETFFLYAKVNNIFDYRYNYRKGFPEQGRTFLGGLRIII